MDRDTEQELRDALEVAWGIICNAGGGDWSRETAVWQEAAARFRRQYFALTPSDYDLSAIDSLISETFQPVAPPAKRRWWTRLLEKLS